MKVLMQRTLQRIRAQYQDRIVDWLPEDSKHVLIGKPGWRGTGVSRLNIYSGGLTTEGELTPLCADG